MSLQVSKHKSKLIATLAASLFISGIILPGLLGQAKMIRQSQQQISIEFDLPEITRQTIDLDGVPYQQIQFSGARLNSTPGEPMTPYYSTRVIVPPGASVAMSYQIANEQSLTQLDLLPVSKVSSLRENNRVAISDQIYNSGNPYPGTIVEISSPYTFKQMRMVDLRIYPVQYHPAAHRVRLLKKLNIQLQFSGAKQPSGSVKFSNTEIDLLENSTVNFGSARRWATPTKTRLSKTTVNYNFVNGDWFRFPITAEGVYRITGSTLQEAGINISTINSGMIQLFNHGGARLPININSFRPPDLNEVAVSVSDQNNNGIFDSNDEILFYAKTVTGWRFDSFDRRWEHQLNPYSFTNYFLMTFNQDVGKRIETNAPIDISGATQVTAFQDQIRLEEESYNILESGLDWYWKRYQGIGSDDNFSFTMPQGFVPGTAQFISRVKGGSGAHYWDDPPLGNPYRYTFEASINGTPVGQSNFTNSGAFLFNNAATTVQSGSNTFQLNYTGNQEGCYAFLDYFEIRFDRQLMAENNRLKIYYLLNGSTSRFDVSGLPSGTNLVWDITDYANIRNITPASNGSTVQFADRSDTGADAPHEYMVFSPSIAQSISGLERIDNSPNLRDANRRAKVLMIVADEFYDAAAGLEDFKETTFIDPMQVERVRVSDIFREFSSYIPDPGAIRDFIKFAAENWGSNNPETDRPEYVFIIGDGSYDYRNIELTDYVNRVPVYEITASDDIQSRVTDNFFVSIDESAVGNSNLKPQLAIGRLPANSTADVDNYLRKLQSYRTTFLNDELTNGWQSSITLVADDECVGSNCNEWFHLRQTEDIVRLTPEKFDINKIYLTDFETQAGGLGRSKPRAARELLDYINRGTLIINYFGHGDPNTWAHEQVLNKARDLPLINNGSRLPLWIAATCTWGKYDDPNSPSMAEEMIWSQTGGISVLAASRPVFAFQNELFVETLFRNMFNFGSNALRSRRLGDAALLSLNQGSNDQKYHIFGDPTLLLADPEHRVTVQSISADTLKALSTVSISATIQDSSGQPMPQFNGKALIRVYDAVDERISGGGTTYKYQGGTIFKGIVSVENGRINDGRFIVPKSIKYRNSRSGRLSIYAWSNENQRDAVGYVDTLLFFGTESQVVDTEGPQISLTFPDQPDFFDGDYVSSQPTISVRLEDENGINLTGEVGHLIELTIDGGIKKNITDFFVYDENQYTRGELSYTMPPLSEGPHEITVTAWDNLNNYSESKVNFTTSSASSITLNEMVNFPNPFSEETQFTFQFQSPNGSADVNIKIYTVTGRLIQELEGMIARPGFNKIPWDGRDREGDLLANGVYLYKIIADDGNSVVEKIDKLAITR